MHYATGREWERGREGGERERWGGRGEARVKEHAGASESGKDGDGRGERDREGESGRERGGLQEDRRRGAGFMEHT